MHHRNLLYTAVTRAQKSVIMLGDHWGIENCAKKRQVDKRNTFLSFLLRDAGGQSEGTGVQPLGSSELLIGPRIPDLKQTGAEWRGPCPVHHGDGANFAVNPEDAWRTAISQCGRGWSILQLEREFSGRSWKEMPTGSEFDCRRPERGPSQASGSCRLRLYGRERGVPLPGGRYEPRPSGSGGAW